MAQAKHWQKQLMFVNALVVFFFIVDRFLKLLALNGTTAKLFFINFSLFKNPYIAFSIPLSGLLFYVILIFILFFVISDLVISYKKKRVTAVFSLGLIFIGAVSNILDRILYGAIIDYIDTPFLFAFNIADTMIVVGVIILFLTRRRRTQIRKNKTMGNIQ